MTFLGTHFYAGSPGIPDQWTNLHLDTDLNQWPPGCQASILVTSLLQQPILLRQWPETRRACVHAAHVKHSLSFEHWTQQAEAEVENEKNHQLKEYYSMILTHTCAFWILTNVMEFVHCIEILWQKTRTLLAKLSSNERDPLSTKQPN